MPVDIHCPKCPSTNVIFSKKRSAYVCEDCGHVLPESLAAPMRIFLSYGHDANDELVRRIKADLEKPPHNHDVWFDKIDIKFGDDWRRAITDGILHSQRVVSFLSKHSARDPGVCRDEIAIAIGVKGGNIQTILVESEAEVQPPVNISHIQWLDMHNWKEAQGVVHSEQDKDGNAYAVGDAAWEDWYQAKFAEIVRVVESDESQRFAGEIETLHGYLKPIKSDARIYDLLKKGFVGRAWLFTAVEKWRLDAKRDSRLFWITGDPGVGKSAFIAQLTHTRSDAVIATQFVEWDKPDHRDAQRVVRSLAFQLATRLPDYRKVLLTLPEIAELDRKDAAEMFDYLLTNPLRFVIRGGRERCLILIDALDEAGGREHNELVDMLAHNASRLPSWIGIAVSSRPEEHVTGPLKGLEGLNPVVLDTATESNRADIRDYLRHELAPQLKDRSDADRLVDQILERSEGVFLFVERFCGDVRHGHLSLDRPEQFPQGLSGIFRQYFKRQFPDLEKFRKEIRPALRAILAAREPLPIAIIQQEAGWSEENPQSLKRPRPWKRDELHDYILSLGSLFPVTWEYNVEVIKPYHKALADWLTTENIAGRYFVSVADGEVLLAGACWSEFQEDVMTMPAYSLRYAVQHLRAVGRVEDARILWEDKRFRRRRIEMGILNLFLSASWRGDVHFTNQLHADLLKQRFAVWSDRAADTPASQSLDQKTTEMIKECDSVVLVISPESVASGYARYEWRLALESDKPIFPILRLPDWLLVPDELKLLQFGDFRDDAQYTPNFVRLNELLRQPEPDLAMLVGVPSLPPAFAARPGYVSNIKQELLIELGTPIVVSIQSHCIGLYGRGGVGKSVLAAAVARDREVRRAFPDGVLWVSAEEQPDLTPVLQKLASHFGIRERINTEAEGQVVLKQVLADKALLLVLDDLERQPNYARCLMVLGPKCRALLTTREMGILRNLDAKIVPVCGFSSDEALQFIAETAGVPLESLPSAAEEIMYELGHLPLALALCGAFVKQSGCSWADYLGAYRQRKSQIHTETGTSLASLQVSLQRSLDGFSTVEQSCLARLCIATKDGPVSQESVHEIWLQTGNLSCNACAALLGRFQKWGLVQIEDAGQQRQINVHQLLKHFLSQINSVQ